MDACRSLTLNAGNKALGGIKVAFAHGDGIMFVVLVNRVNNELRSRELSVVEGSVAPVVVAAFKNNLVRVSATQVVRTRNHRILIHGELLRLVEALFLDQRFKHMRRSDTGRLQHVAHGQRVVALVLSDHEGKTFSNGTVFVLLQGVDMNSGNLFGRVDGTAQEHEGHVGRSHRLTVAPLGGGVQVHNDGVVIGKLFDQGAQKGFDLTIQGVVGDERFVHQVEASAHRPGSHPAFRQGVERTRGVVLLARQVQRLLTGKRATQITFRRSVAATRKERTGCRKRKRRPGNRFKSNHVCPLL